MAVCFVLAVGGTERGWPGEVGPDPLDTPEFHRWSSLVPLALESQGTPDVWTVAAVVVVDWGPVVGLEREGLSDRLDRLWTPLGRTWRQAQGSEPVDLRFEAGGGGSEGYAIGISHQGVVVRASAPAGRYYALVTLTQLLPPTARTTDPVRTTCGRIVDAPELEWRGLMLDSSRHMQSVDTLEWVLELMALHKLNRFHWHLTDDQGWRLPVAGWPLLTEVGAWRLEAGQSYGGWYTESDIRRVVAFAAQRHIIVVPEVDLPGHASAALAAYPELSAAGTPRAVPLDWGVADGVLSLGRASVTRFTADVLGALVDLFPGPWIHWGGDEVYRTPWMKNAESLAWMKRVKATTADQALSAFWSDLARQTLEAGRTPIGWDEVVLHRPPAGTVVQWWDDPARALAAVKAGYSVIAAWKEASYLDYPEVSGDGDRAFWMPVQDLNTVAAQPFWPPGTPSAQRGQLLGIEAGLWTERAGETKLGRKLFPRLSLVADLAWTATPGGGVGWPERIEAHRGRLEAWGVGMPPSLR